MNLITTAYAAAANGNTAAGGGSSALIMILLMVAIFYFIIIRPENKRKKEAEGMRNALKKGDWITTIGGVYGRVVSVTDKTVVIETSEDRVRVEFVKNAIGTVGTLDEQATAQQQAGLFGKKNKKAAEEVPAAPAVEEPAVPAEEPAEEEKAE